MNDDSHWIELTLGGNPAAFGHLVDRYQQRLFATLYHVTGSREEAEDVVQEAFVQAYTKLMSFQSRSGFYTWLYRIAFNMWSSRRRRRKIHASTDDYRDRTGNEPIDSHDNPLQHLERGERVRLIREALEQLDEEHRAILVLREMDGCDYDTIAQVLDLPAGTVRSRLHRARLQLRSHFQRTLKELA